MSVAVIVRRVLEGLVLVALAELAQREFIEARQVSGRLQ
jgi:hypothetical protein